LPPIGQRIRQMKHAKNEVLVAPLTHLDRPLAELASLPEHRSEEAAAVWTERSKSLRKDLKKSDHLVAARLNFSNGSCLAMVFISSQASPYELHTELRKSVGDLMDTSQPGALPVVANLTSLCSEDPGLAARTVTALAALGRMAGWRPTAFGKKAASSTAKKSSRAMEWLGSPPATTSPSSSGAARRWARPTTWSARLPICLLRI
jgi:hypothetical protein